MIFTILAIGVILVFFSFIVDASSNLLSKLVFKFFPFTAGLFLCYYAALELGWIQMAG